MAGINRLGKGPVKPGTYRPPDPNRHRTIDVFSEDGAADPDYMRAVHDIEEQQQKQGWLFGRGAFDKGDLLYLRDEEERQRHLELELKDSERSAFARLKAQADSEALGAAMPVPKPAKKPTGAAARAVGRPPVAVKVKGAPKERDKPVAVVNDAKKARLESHTSGQDIAAKPAAESDAPVKAAAPKDQDVQPRTQAAALQQPQGSGEAVPSTGLPGLLGEYGSSDED